MKHVLFLTALLFTAGMLSAQTDSLRLNTIRSKPVRTKETIPNTIKPPVKAFQEKLPDLRITGISITAVSTGGDSYTLHISCTVKNEGTATISQAKISLQGLYIEASKSSSPLNSNQYVPACGTSMGLSYDYLAPGASASTSFRCSGQVLNRNNQYVYTLLVNNNQDPKELSFDNNRVNAPILFQ